MGFVQRPNLRAQQIVQATKNANWKKGKEETTRTNNTTRQNKHRHLESSQNLLGFVQPPNLTAQTNCSTDKNANRKTEKKKRKDQQGKETKQTSKFRSVTKPTGLCTTTESESPTNLQATTNPN